MENEKKNDDEQSNYMVLGMCFGMLAGSVAMSILAAFGQIAWGGLAVGIGLIAGMVIGLLIPKKK